MKKVVSSQIGMKGMVYVFNVLIFKIMTGNKCKLTGLMLAFLMTSGLCVYANDGVTDTIKSGKRKDVSVTDTLELKNELKKFSCEQQEILDRLKACIGAEDVRIIQSKTFDILMEWGRKEAKDEGRQITMRLNKETGVYVAMSLPKSEKWERMDGKMKKPKRKEVKAIFKEEETANSELFRKVQNCLEAEGIRIIEAKDTEILISWIMEETKKESRVVCASPNKETGYYTAVSMPKTGSEE